MYSSVIAIPQTIDVGKRRFNAATINDADTSPDALVGTTAKQVSLSGYGVAIRPPGIRTMAPSSTTRISAAQADSGLRSTTATRIICDHAAPPVGYHYEQIPGTTGNCNMRLVANAVTTCPAGQTKNSAGVCVANATTCPTGTTKDPLSGACVANTGAGSGGSGGATPPPASTPSTTSGWVTAVVAIAGLLAVAGRIGR